MKNIFLLVIAILITVGCDTRTDEQIAEEYFQKKKEIKKQKELQEQWHGYHVIVIDGCEYIEKTVRTDPGARWATESGYIAHKGNCRFCKERKLKELERLIIKLNL